MNAIGVYWSVMHRRPTDYDYFKRLQPSVFKIMDGGANDYAWVRDNLPNALVIARDWALSEQHADMLNNPTGTGKRHAQEWRQHQQRLGFDPAKTLILGINEPRVWDAGVAEALRQYTIALCDEATALGLRVGAMQLSVGWPANNGPDTPPDWSPYHGVEQAIQRNNGALVVHEYWADNGPGENWGWWAGRVLRCPWQVPIIIGESGIDMYVKDGGIPHAQRGWRGRKSSEQYANDLAEYVKRMSADSRFKGSCVFASDFANREWYSFDVEPAYNAILATPTTSVNVHLPYVPAQPTPQPTQPEPAPSVPKLTHPIQDPAKRIVTQVFGVNPDNYARFGMAGHNGVDFGVPEGTPIVAVDDGVVVEAQLDEDGYGEYVKVRHSWGESLYAHLSRSVLVPNHHAVKGHPVGYSGNTGNSTGPHLHFGIRVNPYTRGWPFDGYSDPLPYLGDELVPTQPQHGTVQTQLRAAAYEFGLEWELLTALAWAESSFNPRAESKAGAKGLLQLMPGTWDEWRANVGGDDIFNAAQNARVGAAYLAHLARYYRGDLYKALVAYNFGPGRVDRGETPPASTVAYVERVLYGRDLLKAVEA